MPLVWALALGCSATAPVSPRDRAVDTACAWLAAYDEPRSFDALIGTHALKERTGRPACEAAYRAAAAEVDLDEGHPLRRLVDPTFSVPREDTRSWTAPAPGAKRVNVNRVLVEAAYGGAEGLRPQTVSYLCGPMRDEGGYQSTHALWAALIAQRQGGPPVPCVASLVEELVAHQPETLGPTVQEVDLYAERLLMVAMAQPAHPSLKAWSEVLIQSQQDNGSWGQAPPDLPPYWRFHATMGSAWALALAR